MPRLAPTTKAEAPSRGFVGGGSLTELDLTELDLSEVDLSEVDRSLKKGAYCERGLWSVMQRRRNSSRVIWFSRNDPRMADVIVFEFCFCTPRIIMHR